MSDVTHTPGPWALASGDQIEAAEGLNGGHYVAVAHGSDFSANARLIAAAPEQHDALVEMVVAFAEGVSWSPEQRAAYEKARAAIAKATGRAA